MTIEQLKADIESNGQPVFLHITNIHKTIPLSNISDNVISFFDMNENDYVSYTYEIRENDSKCIIEYVEHTIGIIYVHYGDVTSPKPSKPYATFDEMQDIYSKCKEMHCDMYLGMRYSGVPVTSYRKIDDFNYTFYPTKRIDILYSLSSQRHYHLVINYDDTNDTYTMYEHQSDTYSSSDKILDNKIVMSDSHYYYTQNIRIDSNYPYKTLYYIKYLQVGSFCKYVYGYGNTCGEATCETDNYNRIVISKVHFTSYCCNEDVIKTDNFINDFLLNDIYTFDNIYYKNCRLMSCEDNTLIFTNDTARIIVKYTEDGKYQSETQTSFGQLRLIKSITLDENADRVDINTDTNDYQFDLSEVYINISGKTYADEISYPIFAPNDNSVDSEAYIVSKVGLPNIVANDSANILFTCKAGDGYKILSASGYTDPVIRNDGDALTSISLFGSFASGTTIEILGIDRRLRY